MTRKREPNAFVTIEGYINFMRILDTDYFYLYSEPEQEVYIHTVKRTERICDH